jgi:succinate dehydrogenase / fumarate reductase cytochrome b subunit
MAQRPVDLNPLRVHLPVTGWVSILHRVSGALLFAALPIGAWALSVSLSGEAGFRRMAEAASSPLARLFALGLVWAFAHHFLAGLRHLALDMHCGVDLKRARRSSLVVMLASALLACFAAWRLFA